MSAIFVFLNVLWRLKSFKKQHLSLSPGRCKFANWIPNKLKDDPQFYRKFFFSDEAQFRLNHREQTKYASLEPNTDISIYWTLTHTLLTFSVLNMRSVLLRNWFRWLMRTMFRRMRRKALGDTFEPPKKSTLLLHWGARKRARWRTIQGTSWGTAKCSHSFRSIPATLRFSRCSSK